MHFYNNHTFTSSALCKYNLFSLKKKKKCYKYTYTITLAAVVTLSTDECFRKLSSLGCGKTKGISIDYDVDD